MKERALALISGTLHVMAIYTFRILMSLYEVKGTTEIDVIFSFTLNAKGMRDKIHRKKRKDGKLKKKRLMLIR